MQQSLIRSELTDQLMDELKDDYKPATQWNLILVKSVIQQKVYE
jgi:hypothetical protein